MTNTTVATDVHQTLNVQLNLRAKITFYLELCTDYLTYSCSHIVGPVLNLYIFVYTSLLQDLVCTATTDTIDIGQCNFTSFVLRYVYSSNSYSHIFFKFSAKLVKNYP